MSPPPESATTSDERLVELALEGHQSAYDEIWRRHEPAVARRIDELVRDYDVAQDLVQLTFLHAFDSLEQHDPTRKFSAWLGRIAYSTTMDHFRKRRRDRDKGRDTVPLPDGPHNTPPRGTVGASAAPSSGRSLAREAKLAARSSVLEEAIRALPRAQRHCIRLQFLQRQRQKDIARMLGLPLPTVKSHVRRALDHLQTMLEHQAEWLLVNSSPSDPFYTPDPTI
jgi:RNA polymerase sigma-70 factor (ECF subfamily)